MHNPEYGDSYTFSTSNQATGRAFAPKYVRTEGRVDIVVMFHGSGCSADTSFALYRLEKQLTQSHVKAVVIVPDQQLTEDPRTTLSALISSAWATLRDNGTVSPASNYESIALIAHSHGFVSLSAAMRDAELGSKIHDVILINAAYDPRNKNYSDFVAACERNRLIVIWDADHYDKKRKKLWSDEMKAQFRPPYLDTEDGNTSAQDCPKLGAHGAIFVHTDLPHSDATYASGLIQRALQVSNLNAAAGCP